MSRDNEAALLCILGGVLLALGAIFILKRATRNPLWALALGGWFVWGTLVIVTLIQWLVTR